MLGPRDTGTYDPAPALKDLTDYQSLYILRLQGQKGGRQIDHRDGSKSQGNRLSVNKQEEEMWFTLMWKYFYF